MNMHEIFAIATFNQSIKLNKYIIMKPYGFADG